MLEWFSKKFIIKNKATKKQCSDIDNYLKNLIQEKTSMNVNNIYLLWASKTNMEEKNEFNYFEFTYENQNYILFENDLLKVEDFTKEKVATNYSSSKSSNNNLI
jgi:hypothetical protein